MSFPPLVSLPIGMLQPDHGPGPAPLPTNYDLLPEVLQEMIVKNVKEGDDPCATLPRWCTATRCTDDDWRRACVKKGWAAWKPNNLSWRVHFVQNCLRWELVDAASAGRVAAVQKFLDAGVTITDFVLSSASEHGHLEIVKLLLAAGAGANADAVSMALVLASANGHVEVMQLLLATDARFNSYALSTASKYGHLEIVKLLLATGVGHAPYLSDRALEEASKNGHLEIVKLLLAARAIDPR